jgi:hypothetical protein
MFTLDPNEFWTQALSALLAGFLLLFVQPQWLKPPKQPLPSPPAGGGLQVSGRNHVVNTGQVHGDLHQELVDRSQQTTVITNIHAASPTGGGSTSSDTPWPMLLGALSAAVVGAGLFLVFQPLFLAVSIGAALGLLLITAMAAVRTRRLIAFWPKKATLAVLISLLACGVTVAVWFNLIATERGSLSLDQIRDRLPQNQAASEVATPVVAVKEFFQTTIPALIAMGAPTVLFVVLLILGMVTTFALIFVAWFLVLEWHAYLRFAHDTEAGPATTARAKNFNEGKMLSPMVASLLLTGLALLCSNGSIYDLYSNGLELGQLAE